MDTLAETGEGELIRRIRRRGLCRPQGVVRGIGDDAAVYEVTPGRVAVVSTDMLLEGVHFRLARSEPHRLGRKLLAVNLSDLAAMGATPREAFLALAAPGDSPTQVIEQLLDGFLELASEHQVNLLGGDTCASPQGLVVTVTLCGEAAAERLVYRSGARPGDLLAVTGTLGDAAAGLEWLERGLPREQALAVLAAHEDPSPEVAAGIWLAATGAVIGPQPVPGQQLGGPHEA